MELTRDELVEVLTEDKVSLSTYNLSNKIYIRLFNSNEEEAHIPALYPSTKEYRNKLTKYSNVTKRRVDQINGVRANNRKIDLLVSSNERREMEDLPKPALPKSAEEL